MPAMLCPEESTPTTGRAAALIVIVLPFTLNTSPSWNDEAAWVDRPATPAPPGPNSLVAAVMTAGAVALSLTAAEAVSVPPVAPR